MNSNIHPTKRKSPKKVGIWKKQGSALRTERLEIRCTPAFKEMLQRLKNTRQFKNSTDADILHTSLQATALLICLPADIDLAQKIL